MGIFLLKTFIKSHCKNGYENVKLGEIAETYRAETKKDPVIIVDISSCSTFLLWCGVAEKNFPNVKNLKELLETFINNCFDLGIKLKFVGYGMKSLEEVPKWIKKRKRDFLATGRPRQLFDKFYYGFYMDIISPILYSSDKCEYVRALYSPREYIMKYLKAHGVFAILTNDYSFLMAEGAQYWFLMDDFDIQNIRLSTKCFNRRILAKEFDINPSQLPLLGALLSLENDYPQGIMNQQEVKTRFYDMSKIIKGLNQNEDLLSQLDKWIKTDDQNLEFQRSLLLYRGDHQKKELTYSGHEKWDAIIKRAEERHIRGVSDRKVLQIIETHHCFWPPRHLSKTCPVALLKPLRKTMYGIIFFEHPKDISVTEHTFVVEGYEKHIFEPKKFTHPGLLELWSDDRSKEMVYKRRQVFCQSLNEKLTPEIVEAASIQEEFLFLVLALFYLHWETRRKLTDIEIELYLVQAVLSLELIKDEKKGSNLNLEMNMTEDKFDVREMADLFLLTVEHLLLLNSICGEPYSLYKTCPMNYFDGGLFEFVYRDMKNGNWPPLLMEKIQPSVDFRVLKKKLQQIASSCGHSTSLGSISMENRDLQEKVTNLIGLIDNFKATS